MATPEATKFDLANEIEKLRKYLWLPITHVEFDERYEYGTLYTDKDWKPIWINAKLFVNDEFIGTIPYFSSDHGFGYDTGNHSVFAWDKIYEEFQEELFSKIRQQEPLTVTVAPAEYEPRTSLMLNVKGKEGILIKIAFCRFVDDKWEVSVFGLNSVIIRKSIGVTLTPPPSRTAIDTQISPQ